MITGSNVFYISNFNVIGGVETFLYEICKKYHEYDITVIYKNGDIKQIQRVTKYVKVIKYNNEVINCKKFFCNYEIDIINKVEADEIIQIIHAMYITNKIKPRLDSRITTYLAVSDIAAKEYEELTGIKCKVCRNPLTMLDDEMVEPLMLISATRLTPEKGKERMEILAKELDRANIDYLWLVFTNDENAIKNPNIVFIKPKINVRPYIKAIKEHGYGVQLSDCEGDCYFTRECEALGVPLIVTPVPSFKEQGLIEGKNCYYVPFNMKDIGVERFKKIPKYNGYIGEDKWIDNLVKDKSNYKEDKMKVKLRCIRNYLDVELKRDVVVNEEITVSKERADQLLANPNHIVEFVECIEEKPIVEKAVQPTKKVIKRKK